MKADLVIEHVTALTMDPERRELRDATVAIVDDRIARVATGAEARGIDAAERLDGSGKLLLPGFVNAHCHATHNLMRGGPSDDRVLRDWAINALFPALKAYTREDARIAAQLYCVEAIRSGITTTVDNMDLSQIRHLLDEAVAVYADFGLRVMVGDSFFDHAPPEWAEYVEAIEFKEPEVKHVHDYLEDTPAALARIEEGIRRHHGAADGRIQVWPEPCVALMTSREGLLGAKELARRHGTMLTLHASQSSQERMQAGMTSVEYLETIRFWGPEVLAAHMVAVDANDIRILRRHGVKVAYNPVSNMFVADGIAPIMEYAVSGVCCGIGTDDCNANQSVSMISDLKVAALAQKVRYGSSAAMTAEKVLEMATIEGARAVGMEDQIGSIEVGKKADLCVVDLRGVQATPCHNAASALVYHAYGHEVDSVLVDGRLLLREGRLTALAPEQEMALCERAQAASWDVLERAGMQKLRDRPWTSIP
jgi:cytosine/adenosine deaminase-related metal-dependent hydrolase